MSEKRVEKSEFLLKTAKAIQFWRKIQGYTQETFSNKIGTSRSYVARLEAGYSGISFDKVEEISNFLEISPFTLVSGMPEKDEIKIIVQLYKNDKITKQELENLFIYRIKGKILTEKDYIKLLSIIRSKN